MADCEDRKYFLAFSVFPGIGPVRFRLLYSYFKSARNAWNATVKDLEDTGLYNSLVSRFDEFRHTFDIPAYCSKLAQMGISYLCYTDEKYPGLLREISDAPIVIYVKGKRGKEPISLERTIVVVGTRRITPYGQTVTQKFVEGLVSYGFTIVSGMAYGVDAVAHTSALKAGGSTIAVLGCGIDIIAPPSNAYLYTDIALCGRGAIVSEMPLGLRPGKGLFPARNRIISGLSLGVVVTEGADDSGSLITARYALDQGREVFAVPGPVTSPYSKGPAKLIKNGAKLIETTEDIVEELGILPTTKGKTGKSKSLGNTESERVIIKMLENGPRHIDEIKGVTNLTLSDVAATLTVLEMRGCVKNQGDAVYTLI